jgi:hypothetical protein
MKTIAAVSALRVFCQLGPAQIKEDNQLSPGVRLYQPKNLTPGRARQVAKFVESVIGAGQVTWDDVPHAIVIRSSNSANIDAAEALLKRFDVPEPAPQQPVIVPDLDCTVYLIRASSSSAPAARQTPPAAPTSPVPVELQPAIDEMKQTFGYDRYSLWDAILIQPTGSEGEIKGILPTEGSSPYVFSVSYRRAFRTETRILTLAGFQFSIQMPYGNFLATAKEAIESRITTDVTIHEGQKLVLGKIRLMPSENADLFLVLATKAR